MGYAAEVLNRDKAEAGVGFGASFSAYLPFCFCSYYSHSC